MSFPEAVLEAEAHRRNSAAPGEQVRRNYGETFQTMSKFGKPTPVDKFGTGARDCLKWEVSA